VPQGHHIFSGMVLPDAAAIFIKRDIQRPVELILDIPMLPNHRDEGRGGPHETGEVEAIVTRDRGLLVSHPDSFHRNHRLEAWPFLQRRQRLQVRHHPDASAHAPAVSVVERIKEIGRIAPREIVLDLRMKVLGNSCRGLFVIVLACQEVVATLVQDLRRNGRLTAHRIDGDNAAFDRSQVEQFWYGCDLIGLLLRFELAYDKPSLLRAPSREHVQGRGRRGAMKGRFDRFPIQRDACVLGELCHGLSPGQKALPKPLGIESGKHSTESIVRGNPMWQGKEHLEPGLLALTKKFHILEPFPTSEERA
jgi:hypothetical protein